MHGGFLSAFTGFADFSAIGMPIQRVRAVLGGERSCEPVVEARRHANDATAGEQDVFQGAGFRQDFDVGQPEIGLSGPIAPVTNIKKALLGGCLTGLKGGVKEGKEENLQPLVYEVTAILVPQVR